MSSVFRFRLRLCEAAATHCAKYRQRALCFTGCDASLDARIDHRIGCSNFIADRYKLPAIYPFRYFVSGGGLISYGPDDVDQYRRAAGYVDRILKGEKPADLPVEQSTKVALASNLKTVHALGLEVPPTLLARADEVIE